MHYESAALLREVHGRDVGQGAEEKIGKWAEAHFNFQKLRPHTSDSASFFVGTWSRDQIGDSHNAGNGAVFRMGWPSLIS